MSSELWQRIRAARKHAKLTQDQIADACGINKASVALWESRRPDARTRPNLDNLKIFSSLTGAPFEWLMSDESDVEGDWDDKPAELIQFPGAKQTPEPPSQDDYATIDQFHVNGSCGDGYLNDHVEVKGSMAFKRDWLARMNIDPAQAGVIYAKGDSMTPTIQDGEVLLVDYRQREAQGNRVYVLNIDGHLLVKRLIRRVAGWMIVSDNQDKTRYPDEVVQSPDLINIVGRVVWRGGGL